MTKKNIFYLLAIISILISIFSVVSFLYFNIESPLIYIIQIIIFLVMTIIAIKIHSFKYILIYLSVILVCVTIFFKSDSRTEHMDVCSNIISKINESDEYFIKINNYGKLSDANLKLKVSKKIFNDIDVKEKKYLITYRNYSLNESSNFSRIENIQLD